jgi:hypothetical protein
MGPNHFEPAALRCFRCATKYGTPTYVGHAHLNGGDVVVETIRRVGKRAAVHKGGDRQQMAGFVTSGQKRTVTVPSHGSCSSFSVVLEKLRPALEYGYAEIQVGPRGDVMPIGARGAAALPGATDTAEFLAGLRRQRDRPG